MWRRGGARPHSRAGRSHAPTDMPAGEMAARDIGRKVHEKAVGEKRQMAIERSAAAAGAGAGGAQGQGQGEGQGGEEEGPDVRVLTLNHGEHLDSTLYRFEKGTTLRFCPGPSLLGRKVFLYINYVLTDNQEEGGGGGEQAEFVRSQYYALEWVRAGGAGGDSAGGAGGAGMLLGDADVHAELRLRRAGPFHYYFVYDTASCPLGPQGSGWVQVSPALGAGGARLPLDALTCLTVLAKCLGPLPRWRPALRVAKEAGYNMLHFTPVQALGASDSAYSIADQLRVDPRFGAAAAGAARDATFADVENVVAGMRADWGVLSICDIVLNHTANETAWLGAHPEATYNCGDCPHLRPAALLDALLAALTAQAGRGALEPRVPRRVAAHEHVLALGEELRARLAAARLHELLQCDVPATVAEFYCRARNRVPTPGGKAAREGRAEGEGEGEGQRRGEGQGQSEALQLQLQPDPQRRRLRATVDLDKALQIYNVYRQECSEEEARLQKCCAEFRQALLALNDAAEAEMRDHLCAAVDNCLAGMRYFRLQADGPKIEEVSEKNPLVPRYFTFPREMETLAEMEEVIYGAEGRLVMAHNGWVMDADPLQDFAAPPAAGRVYLRRELIAWGDSVKLRYGARPEDSAWLWAHMREYVELTAEVFDGVRLDNCHSTPLHVAEYMLDCARNVKPDLYVVAELFTNSDHVDNIFVNRLGITSLIREAQSAWDAHEQGRLVYRYGGRAVGSFLRARGEPAAATPDIAHALFMDLTHDNPSPIDKRSVFDVVATAALVSMAHCATGSTRGLDELVPHHVHVVDERRLYPVWRECEPHGDGDVTVTADTGVLAARRALNDLHVHLARSGYTEVYVDQMDGDVVAVTRHEPRSRTSVILVARTAFAPPSPVQPVDSAPALRPLRFEGLLDEILLEADLVHKDHESTGRPYEAPGPHAAHARLISGLEQYSCRVRRGVPLERSRVFAGARRDGAHTELAWRALPPGAVVALRVAPHPPVAAALAALRRALPALPADLAPALADLDLGDFNALLYRCDAEERDAGGGGGGVYDVPGHGPLVYAGLQGIASLLAVVRPADELGHAVCENLRAGDWLVEYQWRRLERSPRLAAVGARVRAALAPLGELPRYLRPAYFEAVVSALHAAAARAALARCAAWCAEGPLARALALTSVQLTGAVPSAPLPLPLPLPGPAGRALSLSAGLPHFATGYMRCWGRDTFVALRGTFLLTGRYEDARAHILGYAACLRHGLIPNLLDAGVRARFNCRDAVWWWLYAIKQYCTEVPGGAALLEERVGRLFPCDDSAPASDEARVEQPLHEVMQEALDAHFQGRTFRERNAGRAIDAHMTDRGFDVQIGVDPETGFPFGGNEANCGTWMDKMGSSERAGNRGRPATPRDGSAVELVALCHAVVSWLDREHRAAPARYPHAGPARAHRDRALTAWRWAHWAERLRRAFERHFWVPAAPSAADPRPDLVHRRAIYKDSHGASRPWADYQLRCNFPVAMVVAPELFDPKHAWLALDAVERHLLGPLGVKTLDPADWAYRPDYNNDDDSDDPNVAHGFNYHQGPEWCWPLGFYLRARLLFAQANDRHARTVAAVLRALGPLAAEIGTSPWRGLPELTNHGGAFCAHSCRTQAWSSAAALEVLHELRAATRATALD